jgi:hypothetical protein
MNLTVALVFLIAFAIGQEEEDKQWKVDQFNTQVAIYLTEDILPGFSEDVKVLVGPHERGWAEPDTPRIVIPTWVFAKDIVRKGYSRYYVCHEMSHIETFEDSGDHGDNFTAKMEELCPEVSFYEKEYEHE